MSIDISDVVIGGVYSTANNQERRVTNIENGKVFYESRGGNVKNNWSLGHILASPPSIENFAEACENVISKP